MSGKANHLIFLNENRQAVCRCGVVILENVGFVIQMESSVDGDRIMIGVGLCS